MGCQEMTGNVHLQLRLYHVMSCRKTDKQTADHARDGQMLESEVKMSRVNAAWIDI